MFRPFVVLSSALFLGLCGYVGLRGLHVHGSPKWRECRTWLKAIMAGERAYFEDRGRYSTHPKEVGFEPELGNRYAYFLDRTGVIADRADGGIPDDATGVGVDRRRSSRWLTRDDLPELSAGGAPGLTWNCDPDHLQVPGEPPCALVAVCIGLLEEDRMDVWSVSTADRWTANRVFIPAGEPYREPLVE